MAKLPAAFLCGVRLHALTDNTATATVRFRWINSNPFGSMYFAVQMMAAELSTGILVMNAINTSQEKMSMLVTENHSAYSKKVTGKVFFTCDSGNLLKSIAMLAPGEILNVTLESEGRDASGEVVSKMSFGWRIKAH